MIIDDVHWEDLQDLLRVDLKKRKSLNSQMLSTSRMSLKPAVPLVLSPFHVFDAAKTPAPRFSCDIIPVDLEYIQDENGCT